MNKPHNIEQFFKSDCQFVIGAYKAEHIKESRLPEIAFIGRSNVGKSSLINSLVNCKIAITSKTPGRTRQLNFFELGKRLSIVDMPGYGYAKVGKKQVANWEKLSYQYFASRINLKRVFVLIDARRNIGEKDKEIINIFDSLAVSYQLVLTKTDQLKPQQLEAVIQKLENESKKFPALHPTILATSSINKKGVLELRKAIVEIM